MIPSGCELFAWLFCYVKHRLTHKLLRCGMCGFEFWKRRKAMPPRFIQRIATPNCPQCIAAMEATRPRRRSSPVQRDGAARSTIAP